MSLEPIEPQRTLELYLADRENNLRKATKSCHRFRLGHFIRRCDEQENPNLNELSVRQLHEYRQWRRDEGDLSPTTEKPQIDTLRVFIRWLESIDGIAQDFHAKVLSPTPNGTNNIRDVILEAITAG